MSREYRRLLPTTDKYPVTDPTASVPKPSVEVAPKRKRIGVEVACNLCRSKKTRCDGARPVCDICKKRGIEKCFYSDKRDISDGTSEILDLLKSETESTAIDILRLLRSNHDPSTVLALIRSKSEANQQHLAGDLDLGTSMPQNSLMEAELVVKNPTLYPVMHSLSISSLVQSQLFRSAHLVPTEPRDQQSPAGSSNTPGADHAQELDTPGYDFDSAIRRFRHPKSQVNLVRDRTTLCDERLSDLDISFWTTVPIPNRLAAKVISLYLVTDHPLLGTFEPGQFVADLVNHRLTSCSHFLVNTLLYWGCQMYSAIEKETNDYAQQLSAEA
ncbi:zinc finger protein, partial [Seiridium cupressi]